MRRTVLFLVFVAGMVLMTCGVAGAATCQINGGAAYTNDPVVSVHYVPGVDDLLFRISNYSSFASSSVWQPIQSPGYADWALVDFAASGKKTVYMQFASDSTSDPTSDPTACQDSIILDRNAPRSITARVRVRRGHVCYLPMLMRDATSPKCKAKLWITRRGVTKKTFASTYRATNHWWRWRYRCKLPRGTYHINVRCRDLAGNVSARRWARLIVR
jgi:hypothetical protein